jgi:type IV pilus assembly protein PilM
VPPPRHDAAPDLADSRAGTLEGASQLPRDRPKGSVDSAQCFNLTFLGPIIMAAPARILSLNLGTQTIGLAEFHRAENGGVMLNGYRLTEILSDPSAESARLPQTRLAVSEMKDALKVRGGPINYAISGQNIFARFVKLPTVAEEKVEQIIGFEAQQNVPFPIEEVVWDYQLVGNGQNGQVEVVLVAIKSDLLDDLNAVTEGSGFRTQVVDAAPMALYNAFRYNYSDQPGCSLLVDLGARTTNLIFVEPGKVFSRSIPIGGNTITANLGKEFGESFGAAEERKKREGYVSLGGAYADDANPTIAKEAKIIRNTMTRLHAEISRSINFYRAQQSGTQPARIFLCGGTANLPYLREFFAEKFQLPIEFFNPLKNVAVTGNVNVEEVVRNAHLLGELVGLSLRGINNCPMELNLRPTSVVNAQRIAARRPFLILAGVCVLLALAGWWLYLSRTAAIESTILAGVNTRVSGMRHFEDQFNQTKAEIAKLVANAAPLTETVEERQFWAVVINELNARLPEKYVWITLLEPTSGPVLQGKPVPVLAFEDPTHPLLPPAAPGAPATAVKTKPMIDGLHIRGLYLYNDKQDQVVSEFVENLAKSPLFKLDLTNQKSVILNRGRPNEQDWAFPYELELTLRHPLPLH